MFLITVPSKIFWDKKHKESIFLGEWCRLYEHEIEGQQLTLQSLEYIWNDFSDVEYGIAYCQAVCKKVLKKLFPFLNELHAMNKSLKYWDLLLHEWLFSYVQIMYDRYRHIKLAQNRYSTLYSYVIDEKAYQYINLPRTFFYNAATNDEYNLQLYSQIIKFLNIQFEIKPIKISDIDTTIYIKSSKKEKLFRNLSKFLNRLFNTQSIIIVNSHFKCRKIVNIALLSLKSRFLFVFDNFQYDIFIQKPIDVSLRESLFQNIYTTDEFEALIYESLKWNFPIIYLEAFKDFRLHVNQSLSKKPQMVFSKNALHHNEFFKFYCAENHGDTKIGYAQHGGNIGIDKQNIPEIIERKFADIYFSNGWTGKKVRILSIQKCDELSIHDNCKINLIMTSMPRYFYRFMYVCEATKMLRYIQNTNIFCNHLDNLTNRLVIRTYMEDYGWHIKERLLKENKNLIFDNTTDYNKQILSSRLNVFDHMHTGYLESFNINKPTVIFIMQDLYLFRIEAQPFIQKLKEVNILFDSSIKAANFVKTIYDDVDAWWLSSEVQKAKNAFCERYAKSSDTWIDEWVDELNRVVNT